MVNIYIEVEKKKLYDRSVGDNRVVSRNYTLYGGCRSFSDCHSLLTLAFSNSEHILFT